MAEQVDAQLIVLDADMHMHAADHQPARHLLQIFGEHVVALLVGVLLTPPFRKGMRGGGDRREAELIGDGAHGRAQPDQFIARLLHGMADARADLDLRAQEFRAHLTAVIEQRFLAFGEQGRWRFRREVAAVLVDEEVFLLDAEGEAWFVNGHIRAMWHSWMTACTRFAVYWMMPPRSTPTA